jgi:hypothetical protein
MTDTREGERLGAYRADETVLMTMLSPREEIAMNLSV